MIRRALLAAAILAGCGGRAPLVERPPDAPRAFVIADVRVFDAPNAALHDGRSDVVVRDGRIAEVVAAGAAPRDLRRIDGRGGTLLPGLVDVHVHTDGAAAPIGTGGLPDPEDNLQAFLYGGTTTVLDAGAMAPAIFRLRDRVRAGRTLGPHLYAAGPVFTAPGGHPAGFLRAVLPWWARRWAVSHMTREVDTPDAARAAVAALLPEHPDVIKIAVDQIPLGGPHLGPAVIAAITAAGHAAQVRTVAHVGRSADVVDAVRGGVDALMHDVYVEEISDQAVQAVAEAHVPVTATIGIFDAVAAGVTTPRTFEPLERDVALPEVLALRPAAAEREEFEAFRRAVAAAHAARRSNVARLRAAGVTILAGTDSPADRMFPGAAMHAELAKLVEAGLTPGEALRAATVDNARFLAGPAADFGTIAPGMRADLLLVDGDPVAHIADSVRIAQVILDGVPLRRIPRNR